MLTTRASCQICNSRVTHAPGMPGMFSPPTRVSDPAMHHGTCVTHVPWCMPGSLTSGFIWSRWRKKTTFPAFAVHVQPKFYISGKRPMWVMPGPHLYACIGTTAIGWFTLCWKDSPPETGAVERSSSQLTQLNRIVTIVVISTFYMDANSFYYLLLIYYSVGKTAFIYIYILPSETNGITLVIWFLIEGFQKKYVSKNFVIIQNLTEMTIKNISFQLHYCTIHLTDNISSDVRYSTGCTH